MQHMQHMQEIQLIYFPGASGKCSKEMCGLIEIISNTFNNNHDSKNHSVFVNNCKNNDKRVSWSKNSSASQKNRDILISAIKHQEEEKKEKDNATDTTSMMLETKKKMKIADLDEELAIEVKERKKYVIMASSFACRVVCHFLSQIEDVQSIHNINPPIAVIFFAFPFFPPENNSKSKKDERVKELQSIPPDIITKYNIPIMFVSGENDEFLNRTYLLNKDQMTGGGDKLMKEIINSHFQVNNDKNKNKNKNNNNGNVTPTIKIIKDCRHSLPHSSSQINEIADIVYEFIIKINK